MDANTISSLARRSPAARVIFEYLAGRQRNSTQTTVDALVSALEREGHEIPRGEVVFAFRELENAHCGKFLVGRKGHPTRFEWAVPLSQVGVLATSDGTVEPELEKTTPPSASPKTLEHRYILRRDYAVTLALPADLTDSEATRLADFIRTIPFT